MLTIDKIYCGDCLELMKEIPDKSIDMILCDLPYGVTQNEKDVRLNLNVLWSHYNRISKISTAVVLTAQFPFTAELYNSNSRAFRYDMCWDKRLVSGFLNANRIPLRVHENILVFYNKQCTYNPQKSDGSVKSHTKGQRKAQNNNYGDFDIVDNKDLHGTKKYPTSIINFTKDHPSVTVHPTQKPVELFEYLIKTYSNEEDTVLDNCMGSGTTAVACINTNRHFIGIEKEQKYVDIANERAEQSKFLTRGSNVQ